ncbi:MAG: hypothetical protein K2N90_06025 [Lachnospiraceae bacterium]|nr:hypothetical protein [Lachnospiraceae bacterium]
MAFYGAGKAVEALKRGLHRRHIPKRNQLIVNEQKPLIELDLQFFAEKHPAEYYFRGTSEGFAGNNALIRLGITPTSTDPLISTVFALRSEQYGKGVLYIAFKNDLKNIEIGSSNFFKNYEKEVCFNILPLDFAKRVHMSIAAKDAK